MTAYERAYRFRIHDGVSDLSDFEDPAVATGNLLNVSSVPTDDAPYIADPPSGDGSSIDLITGKASVGEYHVTVIDAEGGDEAVLVWSEDFEDGLTGWTHDGWGTGSGFGFDPGLFAQATRPVYSADPWVIERTLTAADGIVASTEYRMTIQANVGGLDIGGVQDEVTVFTGLPQTRRVTVTSTAGAELHIKAGFITGGSGTIRLDNIRLYEIPTNPYGRVVTRNVADTGGDRQYLSKRAAVEITDDGGATYETMRLGYVNNLKLADALVWDFTVGETRRAELQTELFRETPPPGIEATAYGDVVTTPSLLLGGPVREGAAYNTPEEGAFGGVTDYGPVRMETVTGDGTAGARVQDLKLVGGYLGPLYIWFANEAAGNWERQFLQEHARSSFVYDKETWIYDAGSDWSRYGYFPELVARLTRVSDAEVFYTVPLAAPARRKNSFPVHTSDDPMGVHDDVVPWTGPLWLGVDWDAGLMGAAKPADGVAFDVELYPRRPSKSYPIHEKGHPVALVAQKLDAAGVRYDAASFTAGVTAINTAHGGAVVDELVWESAVSLEEYHRTILAFHGMALRPNEAGELELFGLRHAVPVSGEAITLADLREPGSPFDLGESSIVTTAATKTTAFQLARLTTLDGERVLDWPLDQLQKASVTINGAVDATVPAGDQRTHVWTLPGRVLVGGAPQSPEAIAIAAGTWLVDWKARGAETFAFPCLPGTTAQIGDAVELELPHLPVSVVGASPVTQRGQASVMARVTQRTETPEGPDLELVIAPPADQAVIAAPTGGVPEPPGELAPTFTLAAFGTDATRTVEITLTNADDFADLGQAVTFAYEVGATEPTGLGSPGPTIAPGDPDVVTIAAPAGSTVWVRAKGAGAWTAWQSITLANDPPPPPALSYDALVLSSTGVPDVTATLSGTAVSVKIAAGAVDGGPPSATDVRAATALTVAPYEATFAALDPGESLVVGAFAYDAGDTESAMAVLTITRADVTGGGAAGVPTAEEGAILYGDTTPAWVVLSRPSDWLAEIDRYVLGFSDTGLPAWRLLASPAELVPYGGPPTVPTTGAIILHEADAITPVTDGTAVAAIPNAVGSGPTFSAGPGAGAPLYYAGVINGLPILRSNGNNSNVHSPTIDVDTLGAASAYVLFKVTTLVGENTLFSGNSNGFGLRISSGKTQIMRTGVAVTCGVGSANIATDTWYLVEAHYRKSDGAHEIVVNGVSAATATVTGSIYTGAVENYGIDAVGICCGMVGDRALYFFYGDYHDEATRDQIRGYVNDKYGLSITV